MKGERAKSKQKGRYKRPIQKAVRHLAHLTRERQDAFWFLGREVVFLVLYRVGKEDLLSASYCLK